MGPNCGEDTAYISSPKQLHCKGTDSVKLRSASAKVKQRKQKQLHIKLGPGYRHSTQENIKGVCGVVETGRPRKHVSVAQQDSGCDRRWF
jgi:hypothetical protein